MPEGLITLIIVIAILTYLYFSKIKQYEALLKIAEMGDKADEKLLKMFEKKRSHKQDYRSSLIWIAIGIPIAIAIWNTEAADERILGLLPIFVGIALFISGKLRLKDPD